MANNTRVGKVASISDPTLASYMGTPNETGKATIFHGLADGDNFLAVKKSDGTIVTLSLS